MIDCQQNTAHLQSLGATLIAQEDFLNYLKNQHVVLRGFRKLEELAILNSHFLTELIFITK